jgi:hypothetical protein
MSGQKKGFAQFIRPSANNDAAHLIQPPTPMETPAGPASSDAAFSDSLPLEQTSGEAMTPPQPERIRHVTSTGRVRTHSANRALPGVTLRLTEERWERLKMLSIQQRRPIQDILGEAMEGFMRAKGLPW